MKKVFCFLFSVKSRIFVRLMEREKKKSRSYRDLDVWKLSIQLVKLIYEITAKFPASEIYGLTNQIRRAAISIPSNIAEGQGRNSAKEFKQFIAISLGSIGELETQLIIAKEIAYYSEREIAQPWFLLSPQPHEGKGKKLIYLTLPVISR